MRILDSQLCVAAWISMAFAAACVGGCGSGSQPTPVAAPATPAAMEQASMTTQAAPDAAASVANEASATSDEITLEDVDADGFRSAVARHKGSVVLVDYWATWCAPCRERFPHVVELGRKYGPEGLRLVSLSIDEPDSRADVMEFLQEQDARFTNLIGTYGVGTEATEAFEFGGEVPYYKLYDRAGRLRHEFSGDPREQIEPVDQIEQRITELLAEKN